MAEEQNNSVDEAQANDEVLLQETEVQTEVSGEQSDQTQESEDQLQPPTRKTPQDYIMERQIKKRKEAEEQVQKLEQELERLKGTDAESGFQQEVTNDMLEHTRTLERKLEIKDFLATHPEFAGYEAKMLNWSQDSAYARIPAQQLAYAVAGADLSKMSPSAKAEAEREAASSKSLGGSSVPTEEKPPKKIAEMTDQEFRQYQYNVMKGIS